MRGARSLRENLGWEQSQMGRRELGLKCRSGELVGEVPEEEMQSR